MRLGPEDSFQRTCVEFFRMQYRKRLIWSTPNGGHRHPLTALKMKLTGQLAGVPDLFVPEPMHDFHGMFLELKVGKNRLTQAQAEIVEKLRARGYYVPVCYTFDEFEKCVRNYFQEGG